MDTWFVCRQAAAVPGQCLGWLEKNDAATLLPILILCRIALFLPLNKYKE